MNTKTAKVGDLVWWRRQQPGGYRWITRVPAVVVRMTARRAVIDAALATGGTKRVSVMPGSLIAREAK